MDKKKRLPIKKTKLKKEQILNDPTNPVKHYVNSRRSNTSGRFLSRKQMQTVIKRRFDPLLCWFLTKVSHINCVRVRQDVC